MKKSVGAIIIYKNKFLLQKRDKKNDIYFPDLWGVFGGSLKNKESPKMAVEREIMEEINVKLKFKKFLENDILSKNFNPRRRRYFFYSNIKYREIKKIVLNEGKSFDFFNLKQLEKLSIVPWDYAAIKYFYFSKIKKMQVIPQKKSK